jgi:hypothetical protein
MIVTNGINYGLKCINNHSDSRINNNIITEYKSVLYC